MALGRPSIWDDEAATLSAINRPAVDILQLARTVDAPHNAYYVFLHFWTGVVGQSEFALRLPSLLAMTVTAGLVSALAGSMVSHRAGIVAGSIFAIFPATAGYSANARPYAFAIMFAALALLTARWTMTRSGRRWWVLHLASLVALAYASLIALVVVPGIGLYVLANRDLRTAAVWAGHVLVTLIISLPLIVLTREQSGRQAWIPETTLWDIPVIFGEIPGASHLAWIIVGAGLAAATFRRNDGILVWASIVAPPVLIGVMSVLLYPALIPRYLLIVLVPLAVLGGAAVVRHHARFVPSVVVVLLALSVLQVRWQMFETTSSLYGIDYREAARLIASKMRPGDAIVYGLDYRAGLGYYFGDGAEPADVMLRVPAAENGSIYGEEFGAEELITRTAPYDRVWLLTPPTDSPRLEPVAARLEPLTEALHPIDTYPAKGVTITLLKR